MFNVPLETACGGVLEWVNEYTGTCVTLNIETKMDLFIYTHSALQFDNRYIVVSKTLKC